MAIVQAGSINTTALVVPALYVVITPPQNLLLNGVPSNVIGMVGTAQWGPLNTATLISNMADYARNFGALQNRKYDMGTAVATAVQQGANAFRCVRVDDGTGVKAASVGVATCFVPVAFYTGTLGNSLVASISVGSKAATWKLTIGLPGYVPEVFDNVPGTANAFWTALASAVNNGNSVSRGPSQLITLPPTPAGTTAVAAGTYTFTGGTDGTTTITAPVLVGNDGLTRTGMYALRGQGCSIGVLADADASTSWTTIDAFGLAEGLYMMQVCPAGTAISNGSTGSVDIKATAGLDSYATKLLHGDWIWWQDPVNQVLRLVSPQGFAAGRLANLSPEQSGLNKPLFGIAGTQKNSVNASNVQAYSQLELSTLIQAGIDVIINPSAGGTFYGLAAGHNSSSNAAIKGDNYVRMTNYIAATLNAGMGKFVGQLVNLSLFQRIRSTLMSFYANLLQQGLLGSTDGSLPYGVICDVSNNPPIRTGLGYVQADCQVRYQAINEEFIVNLEGGQTVTVLKQAPTINA